MQKTNIELFVVYWRELADCAGTAEVLGLHIFTGLISSFPD